MSGSGPEQGRRLPGAPRQVVEYALQRRTRLADLNAGRIAMKEVCDADPYLLRAAQFHGRASANRCPVCRKEQLTLVSWIFGDKLGTANGSARTSGDIDRLAGLTEEFSVHVVEVCRTCSWNHLVQSYVIGLPPRPKVRRRRPTATPSAEAQQTSDSMEKYL